MHDQNDGDHKDSPEGHSHSHGEQKPRRSRDDLIRLPGSPFWNVFRRFGRDELIALLVGAVGTVLVGFFTTSVLLLAITGPIVEKIGFFPGHFHAVWRRRRKTDEAQRRSRLKDVRSALRGGLVSLTEDVLVHDPIYVMLFFALSQYRGIPIWLIAFSSFVIAVIAVAWLEVAVNELRYIHFKRSLLRAGFRVDRFHEARFVLRPGFSTQEVVDILTEGLQLRVEGKVEYTDRYWANSLPTFSGRSPTIRFRRQMPGSWKNEGDSPLPGFCEPDAPITAQVVYARPQEENAGVIDQFRYFVVPKNRFSLPLDDGLPASREDIKNSKLAEMICGDAEYAIVSVVRIVLSDASKALSVTVDAPNDDASGCVIELKTAKGSDLLLEAMRYVMKELPVAHTTRSKPDLGLFK